MYPIVTEEVTEGGENGVLPLSPLPCGLSSPDREEDDMDVQ